MGIFLKGPANARFCQCVKGNGFGEQAPSEVIHLLCEDNNNESNLKCTVTAICKASFNCFLFEAKTEID